MKIWKLVSGILSIVFFIFITEQTRFVSAVNFWENNRHDKSDVAGVVVAFLILIAGIFSAILWKSKNKGGDFFLFVLYGLAALFGYTNLGTFGDLVVWSSWALLCSMVSIIYLTVTAYKSVPTAPADNMQQPVNDCKSSNTDNTLYCPYCNAVVSQGDIFCVQCGKKLTHEKLCPDCGNKLKENGYFCPHCGKSLFERDPQGEQTCKGS